MATKSVAEKLLIKPDTTVWLSDSFRIGMLAPLPEGVHEVDSLGQATTALLFADDAGSLRKLLTERKDELSRPATFWVAYPKGNRTDINRDTLWPILADYGMRPISQVAVDDIWSALRFRPLKAGEAPFTGGR